jgi:hypothetical protein
MRFGAGRHLGVVSLLAVVWLVGASGASASVGPLSKFVIKQPLLVGAGQAFTVNITAEDALGRTITGYSGTPTWFDTTGSFPARQRRSPAG